MMKMPRVRFKMRALLLAVMLLGACFGALKSRSRYFHTMAAEYRAKAKAFALEEEYKNEMRRKGLMPNECPIWPYDRIWEKQAEKFDHFARNPWLLGP